MSVADGDYFDWLGAPISVEVWGRLFTDERHVGDDCVGEVRISTVWMGLNHNFSGVGAPLIFETMIFGGPYDHFTWRYASEREARAGHTLVVGALCAGCNPDTVLEEQLG